MKRSREEFSFLRLVEPGESAHSSAGVPDNFTTAEPISLFSDASSQTLGFVVASKMSARTFERLLEDVKPLFVFDVREVPVFSDGRLTRRAAFSLFERNHIRYFDVAGAVGSRSWRDAALNPAMLIPNIMHNLLMRTQPISGPVLFFVDTPQLNEEFMDGVATTLPHVDGRGWSISVWNEQPLVESSTQVRQLVFISHANPEDNAIAKWFATRLASVGFDVWSDVTRLIGGELFWESIEDVIRERTGAFIALLSKDGHDKPRVLDEVNVAVTVERQRSLNNFIIPVRVDELDFGDIRANLAGRNIIDGQESLTDAFRRVVKCLDRSEVQRRKSSTMDTLRAWWDEYSVERGTFANPTQWNTLIENRLDIVEWPERIRWFAGLGPPYLYKSQKDHVSLAAISGRRESITFASSSELGEVLVGADAVQLLAQANTREVLDASDGTVLGRNSADVARMVSHLVRQGWEHVCRTSGLTNFVVAGNRRCWFAPVGLIEKNEVRYVDSLGKTRRRTLVGRSEKRAVYWHFAVEAVISLREQTIRLRPHVVFTEDGVTPIASHAKQHSLRRGFCRSWWNDRWRDLLLAMLVHISKGEEQISLPVSPRKFVTVTARPTKYRIDQESSERLYVLPEPKVQVGYGQLAEDPREGLMLFGPVAFERNPTEVRVGVVGSRVGLELFVKWSAAFGKPVPQRLDRDHADRDIPFPGFEAVFGASWPRKPVTTRIISRTDLLNAIRMRDRHQAVYAAVDLFFEEIRKASVDDDAQVDIWFIVIPDEVYLYGRPESRVPKGISLSPTYKMSKRMATRFTRDAPSMFPEDNTAAHIYEHHADFRHQLKARLLNIQAVTQVFRESSILQSLSETEKIESDEGDRETLLEVPEGYIERRMQDPLNVCWNLGVACFFKAGGRPWKVATARPGVCYVGLVFKRDNLRGGGHACCGAQMFMDSGEGLVFKGAVGPWYSHKTKQFHLSEGEARRLMRRALDAYREIHNEYPSELFVHGRTRFSSAELAGFVSASSCETNVTGVRITRTSEYKLFSSGDLPVKRGTVLKTDDRTGLIWTSGFIDRLNTYPGRETPNPLRVEACGPMSVNIETILSDVLTLTKMNFNSSVYADGFPVTMRFADAIGDVLMATGERELPPLPFRHYI